MSSDDFLVVAVRSCAPPCFGSGFAVVPCAADDDAAAEQKQRRTV